jgi:hypothetical protein
MARKKIRRISCSCENIMTQNHETTAHRKCKCNIDTPKGKGRNAHIQVTEANVDWIVLGR